MSTKELFLTFYRIIKFILKNQIIGNFFLTAIKFEYISYFYDIEC